MKVVKSILLTFAQNIGSLGVSIANLHHCSYNLLSKTKSSVAWPFFLCSFSFDFDPMYILIWFGVLCCLLVFLLNLFLEKIFFNKHEV
jgi:hypothetical protein